MHTDEQLDDHVKLRNFLLYGPRHPNVRREALRPPKQEVIRFGGAYDDVVYERPYYSDIERFNR